MSFTTHTRVLAEILSEICSVDTSLTTSNFLSIFYTLHGIQAYLGIIHSTCAQGQGFLNTDTLILMRSPFCLKNASIPFKDPTFIASDDIRIFEQTLVEFNTTWLFQESACEYLSSAKRQLCSGHGVLIHVGRIYPSSINQFLRYGNFWYHKIIWWIPQLPFVLGRCHSSQAAATLVKYERDIESKRV